MRKNVLHRVLPANSTFFTTIRVFVPTGKMFTDGTDIGTHVLFTFRKNLALFSSIYENNMHKIWKTRKNIEGNKVPGEGKIFLKLINNS